jgi:cell division protein FtsI/penicillin-binding protein 2
VLRRGLQEGARKGTGRHAGELFPGGDLISKTGTTVQLDAQGKSLKQGTAAWFLGATPARDPNLMVLVFLEKGTGSKDAAPLGGRLLRALKRRGGGGIKWSDKGSARKRASPKD